MSKKLGLLRFRQTCLVYLIRLSDPFRRKGFQKSMPRDFSKIRKNQEKNQAKQDITKKLGLLRFRQTGHVQKIGTFTEIRYTYESQF